MERENRFHLAQVNRKRYRVCQSRLYVHLSGKEGQQVVAVVADAVEGTERAEEVEIERSKEEIVRELVSEG